MEKIKKMVVKQKWYIVALVAIFLLALFLRFYHFDSRWVLAYDQSRDLLVAREALRTQTLPLIGPFSSAGAFVYGPQFYYLLMTLVFLTPPFVTGPFVIEALLYSLLIFLVFLIGKELHSKQFGLLLGLFVAVSTVQVVQSVNLTSPSFVSLLSFVCVYFLIRCVKYGRERDNFFLAFFVSTSIMVHFQAIGLLALLPVAFLLGKKSVRHTVFLILGFLIPLLPLAYFDFTNNHFESKNLLDYYQFGQYRIYYPNRWLTYVGVFWPESWARIIGGHVLIGYFFMFFAVVFSCVEVYRKKITRPFLAIFVSFLLMFIMLRFFRGERYEGYILFTHAFIFITSGFVFLKIWQLQKYVAYILGFVVVVLTCFMTYTEIGKIQNIAPVMYTWVNTLTAYAPGEKFTVLDYKNKNAGKLLPFVYLLDVRGLLDENGMKIGHTTEDPRMLGDPKTILVEGGSTLVDLGASDSAVLKKEQWAILTPQSIHHSVVEWYKDRK